ncbi:alpha/beta hydrolase [Xanthovirga aplysinae]|uniref:alpha/beta hydrolase n=1 Tax=Xanthovirga aplysinae TaxID=2529853 RepID=UPI0012BCFAFC|nr:alpha/beta hydrolase [Xanthovirga aplysinae]MTI32666.1 alpha/beta hydrolase [Xanthovirga aplysinae]
MKTHTFEVITEDKLKLKGTKWTPEKKPKVVICLLHGLGEHQGRYSYVNHKLVQNDYIIYQYDQRGHGISEGKRGHTPTYDHLLNDVDLILSKAKKENPNLPLLLYGHSFGGNIVINYGLRRASNHLNGLIATSPLLKLGFEPPAFKVALASIMQRIYPAYSESNSLDPTELSTDKSVAEAYLQDPLVHNQITAGLFSHTFQAAEWAIENAQTLKTPMLLMHGSQDKITSPEGSRLFSKNAIDNKVELKIWEGLRHELHQEFEKEKVLNYILNWIEKFFNQKEKLEPLKN